MLAKSARQSGRFEALRVTLEAVAKLESQQDKKAEICDKLLEIYRNKELDLVQKSNALLQILANSEEGIDK